MLNTSLIQIILLTWGCIFCLITAFCIFLSDNYDKKKRRLLLGMQLSTAFLLCNDAIAYGFRSFPGPKGYILVHFSNFFVFAFSIVILALFHTYLCCYLFDNAKLQPVQRIRTVYILCRISLIMLIVSQFTNLYYYFDSHNTYHRTSAYIIALLIPASGMFIDFTLLIEFRKNISKKIFLSLLSYLLFPLTAAVIQLFWYGVPLLNLSICLSMVIIYMATTSEINYEIYQITKKKAEVEERLEIATVLNKCVTELSAGTDIYQAIHNMLECINTYFEADRSYIFEIDHEEKTICNTHEFVNPGIVSLKESLQNIPLDVIQFWMEQFQKNEIYFLSNVEQEKNINTYKLLKSQKVDQLLAVPLRKNDRILGFLGVDNPRKHYDDPTLLSSIQYFIINSLITKQHQDELQYLSYRDMLTNLYNRNKYLEVLENSKSQELQKIGIAYMDLNGLKQVNDTQGHESGDALIRHAASVISATFPTQAYRIGGDEFVIIHSDIAKEVFYEKIQALQNNMEQNKISISIGILWEDLTNDLSALLKQADILMYHQKEAFHQERK